MPPEVAALAGVMVTVVLNLAAFAYGYGKLQQRVDSLKEVVQSLEIPERLGRVEGKVAVLEERTTSIKETVDKHLVGQEET